MSRELMHAAANGDVARIHALLDPYAGNNQLLIRAGRFPDVNFHEGIYGSTALHCAVQGKHTEAAAALIQYGADVQAVNKKGFTPYQMEEIFYGDNNFIEDQFEQQQLDYWGNAQAVYDQY